MIELHVTHLIRRAGRGQQWSRVPTRFESFATLREARRWCRENLGTTASPIYRDQADGTSRRVGRVYRRRETDAGQTWYRQAWCEAYELHPKPVQL